jgi:hypothetical protein
MTQQEWLLLANRLAQRIPLSLREEFVSVARAAHDLFRCDEHLAAYLSLRRWEAGIARDADGLLQASELQQGEIMARLARLVTFGSDRPNPWPAVDALAASVLRLRHCSSDGVTGRAAEVTRGAETAAVIDLGRDLNFQRFSLLYVALFNYCALPGVADIAGDLERMFAFFAPGDRPTLRELFSRLRLLCGPVRGSVRRWIAEWEAAVHPDPDYPGGRYAGAEAQESARTAIEAINPHASIIQRLKGMKNSLSLEDPMPLHDVTTLDLAIKALQAHS